ncbi:hypothetical protein BH24ACT11_BH24ACT11_19950 [soil metagenome]
MSDYATAWDSLCQTIGAAEGKSSGYFNEQDHLTIDQRLKVAEVAALLSIAQELSSLNPQNTVTYDRDGTERNGWGFRVARE